MPQCRKAIMSENSVFIDAAGIATYCGRSIETVRYWERLGKLPPSAKLGRRRVWKRADIEAWLESQFAA
ncbi:regulatory protein MerR [Mycolicibacterium rhodesiae JS60]|nr:regulatory protein MerR [Mycolicibacterium rhodesiae JS60]